MQADGAMDITRLLEAVERDEAGAADRLFREVYQQLRILSRHHRGHWRGDETLNTTALVHEAYLKLAGNDAPAFRNRRHFFGAASRAMRQILVDYARRRQAVRHGGGQQRLELDEQQAGPELPDALAEEVLDLHAALERLEITHPRQARVVECRFFGGLQVEETCLALGVSKSTVKRDWELAKLWLFRELGWVNGQ